MKKVLKQSISIVMIATILAIAVTLGSCKRREALDPTQVEQNYASGVALVLTKCYYKINIGDEGNAMYFSQPDSDGDYIFETEVSDVKPIVGTGTAFFIGSDGTLATNAHVVRPKIDGRKVESNFKQQMALLTRAYRDSIDMYDRLAQTAHSLYMGAPVGSSEEDEYRRVRDACREEIENFKNTISLLEVGAANIIFDVEPLTEVAIAFNDTYVTNESDFKSCVITDIDEENDLAIIQLKDKVTPEGKYVFNIAKNEDLEELVDDHGDKVDVYDMPVGSKLYLIGYNYGPTIASTSTGIKAQVTSGEISQTGDKHHYMYTIPTLGGSSGSPVINEYGDIVAINFAGLSSTQNFNYGIKAKHLRNLID